MLSSKLTTPPVPFVITMICALLISSYLLLDPAPWLYELMELTYTSPVFKLSMLALASGGFAASFVGEKFVFPKLARTLGHLRTRLSRHVKRRKAYKVILSEADVR
jgi:cation-transporting P-type ATPase 13A2